MLQQENTEVVKLQHRLERGGLAQLFSLKGGSRTWFALSCLGQFLKSHTGDPPLSLWISDEGELYPEALHYYWKIPLSRFLLVKTPNATESWRLGVEAVQTGLFTWILLKTEKGGAVVQLRKMQLLAEKNRTKVLLLCQSKLPHWTLKTSIEVTKKLCVSFT